MATCMEKVSKTTLQCSLVLWISTGRGVVYANNAFCEYVGLSIEQVIGCSTIELAQFTSGEIADFFENPASAAIPNRLLADKYGRIFELKTTSRLGITDIIFDEVSADVSIEQVLSPVSGTHFDELTEEELRTVRVPDLRFITVCSAHLKSSSALVDKIPPLEHRIIAGTFWEETGNAFKNNSCTVHPPRSAMCTGFAGAPRYHSDHSLRALGAAFEQVSRIERIRANCSEEGREIPSIGCGVASGNALVGGFGSGSLTTYLSEGDCVECAERLARIASPGEVLITQLAVDHLFANLPGGWHVTESSADGEIDLSRYASHVGSVFPLENTPRVFTVGPVDGEECDKAVYRFEEIWQLENGDPPPTPVFRSILLSDSGSVPNSAGTILEAGYLGRLGKYRLTDLIGSGGMGRVWKAQDFYGNTVAIKTLNSQSAQSEDATRRFRREAEVMSRVPHRNICRIFETGEHDGTHFIVMEYVDGATLSEILQSEAASSVSRTGAPSDISTLISAVRQSRSASASSPKSETGSLESDQPVSGPSKDGVILPIDQTIGLMEKICEAVEFAHQHGVLHRDLKPGNILLRADGEPSVADFGLAKLSGGGTEGDAPSLSLSGQVVGTVENMAPEQAESSKDVDARADVYSLGTILYQMCTGRRHFKATGNFVADLQALQTHEPIRPRAINPSLDSDLEIIILKCLRTETDARYRSVSALLADLRHFQRGEPITAKSTTTIDLIRKIIRRNKVATLIILISFAILSIVVCASFIGLYFQAKKESALKENAEAALISLRKTAPTFEAQASYFLENNKLEKALENINTAISLEPKKPEYLVTKGRILESSFKIKEAIESYRSSINNGLRDDKDYIEQHILRLTQLQDSYRNKFISEEFFIFSLQSQMWKSGRSSEAYAMARKLNSENQKFMSFLKNKIENLGYDFKKHDERFINSNGLFDLNFSDSQVKSLKELDGFPIESLNIEATQVSDISPLFGAPIRNLDISLTRITDLTPLEKSPVHNLNIDWTNINDIRPIKALPIENLSLVHTPIKNLDSLPKNRLISLNLAGCDEIKDVSPLLQLDKLKHLVLPPKALNINILRDHATIKRISFTATKQGNEWIPDHTTKEFWKMYDEDLAAGRNPLKNAEPVELKLSKRNDFILENYAVPRLRNINISGTNIKSLQPLSEIPLEKLDISDTLIDKINVLDVSRLRSLDMSNTKISDINHLANAPLEMLDAFNSDINSLPRFIHPNLSYVSVAKTKVNNIKSLFGQPLKELRIHTTLINDITALRDMPLERLDMEKLESIDLTPLESCKSLREIILPKKYTGLDVLRTLPNLKRISEKMGTSKSPNVSTMGRTWTPSTSAEAFWKKQKINIIE